MATPPISRPSSSSPSSGSSKVRLGDVEVSCYDPQQASLTQKGIQNEQVDTLKMCAKHLTTIDQKIADASATTLFTLVSGLAETLKGKSLHTFRDPEDLVIKADTSGDWHPRTGPDGKGDTLDQFCTNLNKSLKVMGLSPVPDIKKVHMDFKTSDLSAQHAAEDKFRNIMGVLASPPHGQMPLVLVNCDQALTINGAMKQKIPEGGFGGNYCLIGGYNKDQELVLLLDLDKSYPADGPTPAKNSGIYWVPLSDLVAAMNTVDPNSKLHRGYVEFSIPTT